MGNSQRCSGVGCGKAASIRQTLNLETALKILVPLCDRHNKTWEAFVAQREAAVGKGRIARQREADEVGSALAWAITTHER